MKITKRWLNAGFIAVSALCLMLSSGGAASAIVLPDPSSTIAGSPVALQYGDFYSYSLPILAYYNDFFNGGGTGPGSPFYVNSTPGAIQDDVIVATGASGVPMNTNFAGMDNPFPTPTGVSGSSTFSTRNLADPGQVGGPFAGDQAGTWDTRLSALNTYLSGDDLIFFFNNNQVNSGDAANQNLFAWGQVELRDLDNIQPTLYFDFTKARTGNNVLLYNSPGLFTSNYPYAGGFGVWPSAADFVLSGGQIAIDPVTNQVRLNPITLEPLPAQVGDIVINHNLGANQAAYAVYSPELNALIKNYLGNGYDVIRGDFRMTALNNGYEQLFIQRATVEVIPEPSVMALFGAGIFGLAAFYRRKFSK